MDELLNDFLAETSEHLEAATSQLVEFEIDPSNSAIVSSIFRLMHTIKGTCGFLGLGRLETLTHAAEAVIGSLRDGAPATPALVSAVLAAVDRVKLILNELETHASEPLGDDVDLIKELNRHLYQRTDLEPVIFERAMGTVAALDADPSEGTDKPVSENGERQKRTETIRVEVTSLERIMVLVSELVLTRNQLLEIHRRRDDDSSKAPMQRLSALTSDLQDSVMRARMQPLSRLFARLPRLIRELSGETGKKLALVMDGGETELDRQLIEAIRDPLTHILRNAADHGIELPDERRASGKPEAGTIRITASHEAGYIAVTVADDGRGLDLERIKEKALSRGLASATDLEIMAPEAIYRFIFMPAFSTAAKVTSISGRGVGLDVVRENIETIGGSITVTSTSGKGTSFNLKIPLTLAIAPALIVEVGAHRFALPQQSVIEAIGFGEGSAYRIDRVGGAMVLRLREKVIPLVDLHETFGLERASDTRSEGLAIVMRFGAQFFGIIVDVVIDVQEIVVKPLGSSLAHLYVFSGQTILGDGSVVLILDPVGVARTLGLTQALDLGLHHVPAGYIPPREKTRLVLFKTQNECMKAVPLSLISRIETAVSSAMEVSDGMLIMQHRDALMPILQMTGSATAASADGKPILVAGVSGEYVGLLVEEIIDIVEDYLDIEIASANPGVIGSARVRDSVVEILDMSHYLKIARPDALARGVVSRFSVLLIDDRLFFRDMLAPLLTAAGYRVTTASSGKDALSVLGMGAVFNAVITDADMPDMDGYTLAREIKRDPRFSHIPIIGLASHTAPIILQAAKAVGMCGIVGKFDRSGLLSTLRANLDAQGPVQHTLEERIIREFAA